MRCNKSMYVHQKSKKREELIKNYSIMKYLMKKKSFLAFMAGMLILISCGNNDIPTPVPEPEPEETFDLKLKSSDIVELKKIVNEKITEIVHEEAVNIFGERIDLVTPDELQFNGNSLTIVKPHGMVEEYTIKWEKDELFLYNDMEDSWDYCGKLIENDRFFLNTTLFTRLSKNEQRILYVTGQDYSLTSYDQILADPDDVVIWLRLELVYEK